MAVAPELKFTVVYDSEEGEVVLHGQGIHEAITVRKGMVDEAVRHATIIELERLGYRVLPPEEYEVQMMWAAAERGYEDDIAGSYSDRKDAELDQRQNSQGGIDSYLVTREVIYGPWREVQS